MNSLTVLLYLFGHAGAIRRVASSPMAVPVGILLVFSAAVARNYDQVWFGESLWWLFGPLIFSLFSGAWIFLFVARAWKGLKADGTPRKRTSIRHIVSFYGLFWMTAPIAWLYAIPVERWFDPVSAAHWNVRILAIVSVWRVLLMSRVVAVVGEMPFLKAISRVLLPASIEVLVVGFFTSLGPRVMAGMAGLRNSPAEDVLLRALGTSMSLAFFSALVAALVGYFWRNEPCRTLTWRPESARIAWKAPWILLLAVGALSWWISIKPQQEQFLTHQAKMLVQRKDWAGLVAFLSQHRKEEFAPAVPLPPTAWEMWGVEDLPLVIAELTPQTPSWVRELYIGYADAVLEQPVGRYRLARAELGNALRAAKDVPEVRTLIDRHGQILEKLLGAWNTEPASSSGTEEKPNTR